MRVPPPTLYWCYVFFELSALHDRAPDQRRRAHYEHVHYVFVPCIMHTAVHVDFRSAVPLPEQANLRNAPHLTDDHPLAAHAHGHVEACRDRLLEKGLGAVVGPSLECDDAQGTR